MQANDFEKNIKTTMESFTISPNEAVWTNVAQQIAKKQKRRKTIFWFFSTAIICSAIGIFLHYEMQTTGYNSNDKLIVSNIYNANDVQQEKMHSNSISKKPTIAQSVDTNSSSNEKVSVKLQPFTINKVLIEKSNQQLGSTDHHSIIKRTATFNKLNNRAYVQSKSITNKIGTKNNTEYNAALQNQTNPEIIPLTKIDGTEESHKQEIDTASLSKNNSVISNNTTQPKSKSETASSEKKIKFGVTILGGISDNIQKNISENIVASENFVTPSGLVNSRGTSTNLRFGSSLSLGVGGFMNKDLGKRFVLSVGAEYHYFSTTSLVGPRINRATNPSDSIFRQNNSIDHYYKVGDVNTFTNSYHLLQIPLGVKYALHTNTKNGIRLSGYVVPGFLITSNALFENKSNMAFYKNNKQFNRFNLSWRLEAVWRFKNKMGRAIEVGPTLQYQFNSLVNPSVPVRQHLFFTGIRTNFFINK